VNGDAGSPDVAPPDTSDGGADAPNATDSGRPADGGAESSDSGAEQDGARDAGVGEAGSPPGSCSSSVDDVWTVTVGAAAQGGVWSIAADNALRMDRQLLHWDGSQWTPFPSQPPFVGWVRASSLQDIWIFDTQTPWKGIAHFNGTTWQDVSPAIPSGGFGMLWWTFGPNDAWATSRVPLPVGPDLIAHTQTTILRWNGSSWSSVPSPIDSLQDISISDAWASSPSDLWIVGMVLAQSPQRTVALHWDGLAWTRLSPPAFAGDYVRLEGIWGASSNDLWIVGAGAGALPAAWHFDGATWIESTFGFPSAQGALAGIWGSCSTNIWVSGPNYPAGPTGNFLWHYDGVEWTRTTMQAGVYGGTGGDDVWAGGLVSVPKRHTTAPALYHFTPDTCGNGIAARTETCDPPREASDGLQCDSTCHLKTCGNGVLEPGEACDPPNTTNGPTRCDQACQIPRCGNGVVDADEHCDPPNTSVCDDKCQSIPTVCGDGRIQPGETCDLANGPLCSNCTTTTCGSCVFSGSWTLSAGFGGGSACPDAAGPDRTACFNLLSCIVSAALDCGTRGIRACYCSSNPSDCLQGGNGPCSALVEQVAGTSERAEVLRQFSDPTAVLAALEIEVARFTAPTACGRYCGF
jgi:cysteine-rich repeat protein